MAKSKRIIVTICAVLITFVMCTVSANAFQISTLNGDAVAFIPITTLHLNYQVDENEASVGKLGGVEISPPNMSNINISTNYVEPFSYTITPQFPTTSILYDRDDEFAVDMTIIQSTTNDTTGRNITSWGFINVNTETYGRETSYSSGDKINLLSVSLIGSDFVFNREYFDYTNNVIVYTDSTKSYDNNLNSELNYTITFIVPTEQTDGTIALIPISINSQVYYSYSTTQNVNTFPLFLEESDLDNAIRSNSNLTTSQKEYMLNADNFYVEKFIQSFDIPEVDNQYQGTVIQTYGHKSVYATNTNFTKMINELPTGNPQIGEFNLLATIMSNLDGALSVPIIGELTIGWIVWICVAIGALFGILKYFAGG